MRSCADQINGVVDDGASTPKKRLDYSDLGSYGLFVFFYGTTGYFSSKGIRAYLNSKVVKLPQKSAKKNKNISCVPPIRCVLLRKLSRGGLRLQRLIRGPNPKKHDPMILLGGQLNPTYVGLTGFQLFFQLFGGFSNRLFDRWPEDMSYF